MARKEGAGPADAFTEPTSLTRSGREAGAWVYIDANTLKDALEKAGIDPDTDTHALEATRHTMNVGAKRKVAQVLLKIRLREVAP